MAHNPKNLLPLQCILMLLVAIAISGCMRPELSRSRLTDQVGVASWYGKPFHGRKTASGERFDMHALTAAHPHAPFGSEALVTHLATRKQVKVRINDRGPFAKGRIIDLSYRAGLAIGLVQTGTARVQVVWLNVP